MIPVFPGSVASDMGMKRKYENRKGQAQLALSCF